MDKIYRFIGAFIVSSIVSIIVVTLSNLAWFAIFDVPDGRGMAVGLLLVFGFPLCFAIDVISD